MDRIHSSDIRLEQAIAKQVLEVGQRVERVRDAPPDDRVAILQAAAMVGVLRQKLGLGEFVRTLNAGTGRAQLLLTFRTDVGDVVLKIYGKNRPNEAAVQGLWANAGLQVVPVLAHGNDPVSWLSMPYIESTSPAVDDAAGITRELALIMRAAHGTYRRSIGVTRTLADGVGEHLAHVLHVAKRHGYTIPAGWQRRAEQLYANGRKRFLHGDLTPRNLLRDTAGQLLMIDVCGYTGPPEFDAARWCARVGGHKSGSHLLQTWLSEDPDLDEHLANGLLGVELLMEAGVREIVKEEQDIDSSGHDTETEGSLARGAELAALSD